MIKNSRILITGACGSIGSSLLDFLLRSGNTICAFDQSEDGLFSLDQTYNPKYSKKLKLFMGNIRDKERLTRAIENVDIVFHCAAQKHVFLSEYNPFEVVQTNVIGINNIISCALEQNVGKVVFTSSDKAVNPSSTMGVSKLFGEKLITAANNHAGNSNTIFSSVRFGNVLNTNGSVLKIFKKQLKENSTITITSENMSRYFITMDDAIKLCIYCSENMIGGEIFISKMESFKIIDLAKALSEKNNFKMRIIGLKPGEKLYEELITEEETSRTILIDNHYVLMPSTINMMPDKVEAGYLKYEGVEKINYAMNSEQNNIDEKKIYDLLKSNNLL